MKNHKSNICAIIVAAGRGERAGLADGPKQYRILEGRAVLARALQPFCDHTEITTVLVVIHADDRPLYDALGLSEEKLLTPVIGGATRQQSVLAGLQALQGERPDKVLIHDAARPFVSQNLISRVIDGLDNNAAVIPALALADTLKRADADGNVEETVPRRNLFTAQTPQGFAYDAISSAHLAVEQHAEASALEFTDDASIAEWADINPVLVEGTPHNTKLTTRADFQQAREKLAMMVPDVRVGHGYDTHQLVAGNQIWLCGVELPHDRSLSGHSDADVGLHALTDALLATIADGDIGSHFPPSDEAWRDARSDQFLHHAVSRVRDAGGTITHMDVTLVCEAPKIAPHRDAMRQAISTISGVDIGRISIKATTNERIGFVGRNEGMVALSTATVVMRTPE